VLKVNQDPLKDRSPLVAALALLAIVLLALGLRLYRLDAQSLWYDEAFSVYLARMDLAEITSRTAEDIQPPLYYYLLSAWLELFGDSENALRGLSLMFGVLSVPLAYALAWQLLRSHLAGLLAALFLAVSPLHVWYGQEVRMYTLLTFLCMLSSYFLLLVVQTENKWESVGLWTAYTVTSVASMYAHYFAFFVLVFQGLYLLLVWWERGLRPTRLIVGGLVSGSVVVLAYLPWLPHLVTRYGADLSYWPGQLKLHEALIDIVLSFIGGESISEPIGLVLAVGFGFVFLLCLTTLLLHASRLVTGTFRQQPQGSREEHWPLLTGDTSPDADDYPLAFLLLYLLVPPALILVVSYYSPKFNARYMMVSHPAFLIILAGGLAVLWELRSGYLSKVMRWSLVGVSLAFLLGVSAFADYQAYTDVSVARSDFRAVARYVRNHIEPDETVILASGHMFPVFDYYSRGLERHLLPDNPTLDVTRTLDYAIAEDLNEWLADRRGVWIVLWQDEVVDPVGYLETMLSEVGEEQQVDRSFPNVELRHYRLPSQAQFSDEPTIAHPAGFDFGEELRLLGYAQTGEQEVTLFWQALQPLNEDYRISLVLRDTMGQSWGRWDGRPAVYSYPTEHWRAGQTVFGRYDLTPVPGAPPGDYGVEVGVYTEADPVGLDVLDEAGAPQGKRAMLGAVRLSVPAVTANEVDVPHPSQIDLGGGLALLGWDLSSDETQIGDRLLLTLVWTVNAQPSGDYRLRLLLADEDGQVLDVGTFPPTNVWHPTSLWQEGQAWRGQITFRIPIQAKPGEARLGVQLVDTGGVGLGPPSELTRIQVQPTDRTFATPNPQVLRQANFDNKIELVGADLVPNPVAPSGVVRVTLYWRALAEMDVAYAVFVHLLGPDGRVLAGHDGQPVAGARPTTGWVPSEYIIDSHDVSIPGDLEPGEYIIEAGLYDAGVPGLPRLPVLGDEGEIETDRVIFGPVEVR
jgi:4-amino-4-deoxy-L-arabinose transferase-like glycosyltransferase